MITDEVWLELLGATEAHKGQRYYFNFIDTSFPWHSSLHFSLPLHSTLAFNGSRIMKGWAKALSENHLRDVCEKKVLMLQPLLH